MTHYPINKLFHERSYEEQDNNILNFPTDFYSSPKKSTEELRSSQPLDDNQFKLHKSFEFLSPNKTTSKLSTGHNKHIKNSPDYQDRFIPSRVHSNLAIALTAAHDENILPPENDHFNLPNRLKSTIVQAVNQKDLGSQEVSVADIFKTEILGIKPPETKFSQYETKFENRNILAFSSSQKQNSLLAETNMSSAGILKDQYPFGQSSLFSLRYDIKTYFNRTARKISKIPFKVLDAPTLKDDFYLNLIDWGQHNEIAVGLGSCVYLWSASTSQVTKLCDVRNTTSEDSFFNDESENVTSVAWDGQGCKLSIGTSSGSVQIWDTVELKKIKEYNNHHRQRVGALAWNKTLLVSGSRDKKILVRDTRSPHPSILRLLGHKQEVCGLKWSPDNQMLASGGNDNNLFIWNQHSTRPVLKFTNHTAAVKALSWSPHQHGLLISGGGSLDRTIRMWNSQLGEQVGCIETGSQVCNLQFSGNRNEFVSTHGYSDNQVIVWSYPDLDKLAVLTGHTHRVLHLAMSPDGDTIATGAGDETLRFWNISMNDGTSGASAAWQPTAQKLLHHKTQDKKKNLLLLPYKNTIR